jgi:hypothetical protein
MERSASIGSQRYETFTEAVPLSLSSMAHMNIPLQDGVVDGMRQVISHVLLSCVNYARIVYPPHQWSFGDLTTSKFAWCAHSFPCYNLCRCYLNFSTHFLFVSLSFDFKP